MNATTLGPIPRLREGIRPSVLVFLGVRVGLSLLSLAAVTLITPRQGVPVVDGWPIGPVTTGWQALVTATERQDAAWFLRIATGGYAVGDGSAAFFPLYPMAIKALAWLPGIGPLGAALIISNACFVVALVMLHGLTRLEGFSDRVAGTTVLLIAIFPTAFFFLAPYTESPFLLLSVSAFWFARRDRWALAALMGALAALTRSIGLLLVLGLAVEAIQRSRDDGRPLLPRLAAAAAVALGPALYFVYWGARGDLSAPLDAQRNWQRVFTLPTRTLVDAVVDAWRYGTYWLIDVLVVGVDRDRHHRRHPHASRRLPRVRAREPRGALVRAAARATPAVDAPLRRRAVPRLLGDRPCGRAGSPPRTPRRRVVRGGLGAARRALHQLVARVLTHVLTTSDPPATPGGRERLGCATTARPTREQA